MSRHYYKRVLLYLVNCDNLQFLKSLPDGYFYIFSVTLVSLGSGILDPFWASYIL